MLTSAKYSLCDLEKHHKTFCGLYVSLEIDDSIILSMGYTLSNFDLYGGSRNIVIEGRKLNPERHPLMHSFFIGIGYRF